MNKFLMMLIGLGLSVQIQAQQKQAETEEAPDPAEIAIGERLFLETRFAQAYYANSNKADPALDKTITTGGHLRGPFAGKTMNCRSCHMVDEHADNPNGGMRSYADFSARPPVPSREDGDTTSLRNSMSMVNISIPRTQGVLFHYDGEFNSMDDLVRGTFTGRNFGWLAGETMMAIQHLARIIREDDGKGELAQEFGGSYRKVLQGTDKDIPEQLRLPREYCIDVVKASNEEILDAVARLVSAYVSDLAFATDDYGNYIASPYDVFLKKNNLPRQPANDESIKEYNQRLLNAVDRLKSPRFVTGQGGKFKTHQQQFEFTEKHLQGMKLFFRIGNKKQKGGNCASCHAAPHFSDFAFHNTGLTQHNYDALHGEGAFMKLSIPELEKRNADYNAYLPATSSHPNAEARFRSIAAKNNPGYTDLGLWNVFANPDMPNPQKKLNAILCSQAKESGITGCDNQTLLPMTIAAFKTPVLRDLGHSDPYMHTGQFTNLEQAVGFYVTTGEIAKTGHFRNPAPALQHINIDAGDIAALVLFLKSLNEDYE